MGMWELRVSRHTLSYAFSHLFAANHAVVVTLLFSFAYYHLLRVTRIRLGLPRILPTTADIDILYSRIIVSLTPVVP